MPIKLIAADKTDVGRQREQNEDCSYKRIESTETGDRGLFIVADGMGGYQAGEVASRIAVETISKALDSFFKPLTEQPTIKLPVAQEDDDDATIVINRVKPEDEEKLKTRKLPETPISQSVEEQLKNAIQQANRAIVSYGERHTGSRGLGSTVTAVLIENDQAYIANVGDSRTYLLRTGQLSPLTKDHSLVAKLVEARQIEPEDVYSHPQRNLIYRSLGAGHKNIDVDVFQETLQPNDTLLLCSDGLWEMVRHDDLLKALSEKASPQAICDKLIAMANENGGEDNITAVVVHVSAV
ncbi:MAG TPA: PP2C family serine/threonine-protein phosphatase [Ktedonobacteraceae bacterium]|nr:PP2C family serine/threonine-protein phosphatase [Ktedonobacteraceae bacterium]